MGYPYNELIGPAILLDHHGITKEEFIELLDRTHSTFFYDYKGDESWDYFNEEYEDKSYHGGLEGLAGILSLEQTKEFKEFVEPKVDENGFYLEPPRILHAEIAKDILGEETELKPHMVLHTKNIIKEPKRVRELAWDKLKVGDIWEECQLGSDIGIVDKIIKGKKLVKGKVEYDSGPAYQYEMVIRPIEKERDIQKFESMEELLEKWPQFKTLNRYNFRQEKGHFSTASNFLWRLENAKYYLDKETFKKIPESFKVLSWGYTDLILTAEAVKHEAWKLLSYRGLKHLEKFLDDFPDSRKRYEEAISHAHTSIYAKKKNMSLTDMMRMRLQK